VRSAPRVLHVTPYFAPAFCYGGPPRSIHGLCRGLSIAGVDVFVYTTTANGGADLSPSPSAGEDYDGVRVRRFALSFPRQMFSAAGLRTAIANDVSAFDLVHIHGLWTVPALLAAREARRLRIPYVISPRGMLNPGSWAHRSVRKRLAYWIAERRNLSGASLFHATSTAEAKAIEEFRLGVPIAVIPNGVQAPACLPTLGFRRRFAISPDAPILAFIGRIHKIKRLDLVAAAFEQVRTVFPESRLVIAGPDEGGYRSRIEDLFVRSSGWVQWTGEIAESEKWALLADANALVACSDGESFGIAVAEAMAAGVPVVVTDTCGWQDVESAGAGFSVAQRAEAIARGVLRIFADPGAARQMGERGRMLARSRYGWDAIGRATKDAYDGILGCRLKAVSA
jgi:glycosyltransferase involved in cell wall biosynthesis